MRPGDRGRLRSLEGVFVSAARLKRRGVVRKVAGIRGLVGIILKSTLRRWLRRLQGRVAPVAIALSPTMCCNFACAGCYALDYPRDAQLPPETIDRLLAEACRMGVFLVIVTGGEPLIYDGILDILARHKGLVFLLVTNGTMLDEGRAEAIARSGNIVPVVSLEGPKEPTDRRRGDGAYAAALRAMGHLNRCGVLFGFSATVATGNWRALVSDEFIAAMIERGCTLGFYTEYVPIGAGARPEWILADGEQRQFREALLAIRRSRPMIAVHLPDDEYDRRGKCLGVAGGSVHINAQGYVEPCPFAHFAADTVKTKALAEILESEFLGQLRCSAAVIRRGHHGCALVENRALLEAIAGRTGAVPTDGPRPTLPTDSGRA